MRSAVPHREGEDRAHDRLGMTALLEKQAPYPGPAQAPDASGEYE